MKTNSIPHTACFIRIQINVSLSRQARRKDVTIFGDTEAVRAAGPPRPPEQARSCAQAAAVAAVAARGSLVPVCPVSRQHRGGQRPRPRSCPHGPIPAVPAPRSHPASAAHLHARHPDPVPAHRLAAFGVAPRSTPSSAPARGRRSRRLLSRNCHTNCPLAGVHRGPPARTAFQGKLPRCGSTAASRAPFPAAQDCDSRAADAHESVCKLPPPAGARAATGAGQCARGRC